MEFRERQPRLRRPSGGGVALQVGEEGSHAWSLRVTSRPPANGVRSVDIRADKVSTTNILLALRLKDLTYGAAACRSAANSRANWPRRPADLFPRQRAPAPGPSSTAIHRFGGNERRMGCRAARAGRAIQDRFRLLQSDHAARTSGAAQRCRFRLAARFEWRHRRASAIDPEQPPLIFNRIAIGLRFDTDKRRVLLPGRHQQWRDRYRRHRECRLCSGAALDARFRRNANVASALKRMWPALIVPEVREWVIERVERGSAQRIEVGVNSPVEPSRAAARRSPMQHLRSQHNRQWRDIAPG